MLTESDITYIESCVEHGDTTSLLHFIEGMFKRGYQAAHDEIHASKRMMMNERVQKEFTLQK